MRSCKAVTLLLLVVSLLVTAIPVQAWDGSGRWPDAIDAEEDHPWQDDNEGPTSTHYVRPVIVISILSVTATIELPSLFSNPFVVSRPTTTTHTKVKTVKANRTVNRGYVKVAGRNDLR